MAACPNSVSLRKLQALVITKDPEVVRFWRRVLDQVGITNLVCNHPDVAIESIATARFDVIVVDCQSVFTGAQLISLVRSSPSNANACVFALFGNEQGSKALLGANFVLLKPVAVEWALRCLRAAYGSIERGRRRYLRHRVQIATEYTHRAQVRRAIITDISEDGVGLFGTQSLIPSDTVQLTFALSALKGPIELTGTVIWAGKTGCAGVRITAMSAQHRRQMLAGLQELFEREGSVVRAREKAEELTGPA